MKTTKTTAVKEIMTLVDLGSRCSSVGMGPETPFITLRRADGTTVEYFSDSLEHEWDGVWNMLNKGLPYYVCANVRENGRVARMHSITVQN